MPRPDEGLLHAWLDGELDAAEAARIERLVRDDPEWAAAAAEARGLIAASDRILTALDDVPAKVIPMPQRTPARRRTPWWLVRAAAVLVVIVGTVVVFRRQPPTLTEPAPQAAVRQVPPPARQEVAAPALKQVAPPAPAERADAPVAPVAPAAKPAADELKKSEALRDAQKDAKAVNEAAPKALQAPAAAPQRALRANALSEVVATGAAAPSPAEECYAVTPGAQVRATRTSDTTATTRSPQGAPSTFRLHGDTLFIPADSTSLARIALRVQCAPREER